jgi:membrane-associated phospholipid phosphatase
MENEMSLPDRAIPGSLPIANALLIAVGLIGSGIILFSYAALNEQLFRTLNALLPIQNLWMPFTALGDGLVSGCVLYMVFRARSNILAATLVAGLIAYFASQGLKVLFAIARPEHTPGFEYIHLLGPQLAADNFSLPSGHAITVLMMGAFIFQQIKLTTIIKWLLASILILTCLSRIAIGAHWPADILVGAGLGILIGTLCGRLPIKINRQGFTLFIHALFLPFFVLSITKYYLGAGADLHNIIIAFLGAGAFAVWVLTMVRILK